MKNSPYNTFQSNYDVNIYNLKIKYFLKKSEQTINFKKITQAHLNLEIILYFNLFILNLKHPFKS